MYVRVCAIFKIIHVYPIKEKKSNMLKSLWSEDNFLSLKRKENRWKVELQQIFKLLYIKKIKFGLKYNHLRKILKRYKIKSK